MINLMITNLFSWMSNACNTVAPCNLSGPVMKPGFLGQQRGFFVFYTFIVWIFLPNSLANQCLNLLLGISADTPRYSYIVGDICHEQSLLHPFYRR